MTRQELEQYAYLEIEIEKNRMDIKKTEDAIAKLIDEGTVVDKVMGGEGGIQGFKIEGFPTRDYNRMRSVLKSRVLRLKANELKLVELRERIEEWIDGIPNSRDRIIMQMIYINGSTQTDVASMLYVDQSVISRAVKRLVK